MPAAALWISFDYTLPLKGNTIKAVDIGACTGDRSRDIDKMMEDNADVNIEIYEL